MEILLLEEIWINFYKLQKIEVLQCIGLCGDVFYIQESMLRWFMLHRSLIKSGNSSPPRWKNGRNTWRVSQSPRTGTGNLLGVAGYLVGCHDEITRSSPKKIFQLGLQVDFLDRFMCEIRKNPKKSRKDMCGPGPVRNERLFEKDNPTKLKSSLRPTSWGWDAPKLVYLVNLDPSGLACWAKILRCVKKIQHAMGLSFELQMPPKSYSKLTRI